MTSYPPDPATAGRMLYARKGCNACHSIDGSPGIGPTFKGLYGSAVTFRDGSTATADFAYIKESIVHPGARLTAGYANQMPLVPFKPEEVRRIAAWLTTLSEHPPEPLLRAAIYPVQRPHSPNAHGLPGSYAGPHGPADPPPSSLLLAATATLAALLFVGGFALATRRRRA